MLFVAVGVFVAADFRCDAGTTPQPTNGLGGRGRGHVIERDAYIPLCLCLEVKEVYEGVQASKNCDIERVKCELGSGGGCLMYVERGRRCANPQILDVQALGSVV